MWSAPRVLKTGVGQHLGQEAVAAQGLVQRPARRGLRDDAPVGTACARTLLAYRHQHADLGRKVVEALRAVGADDLHWGATATALGGAGLLAGDLDALEVVGQSTPSATTLLLPARTYAVGLGLWSLVAQGLLDRGHTLLAEQQHLIDGDALGLAAEETSDERVHALADVVKLGLELGFGPGLGCLQVDQGRGQLRVVRIGAGLGCLQVDQGRRQLGVGGLKTHHGRGQLGVGGLDLLHARHRLQQEALQLDDIGGQWVRRHSTP